MMYYYKKGKNGFMALKKPLPTPLADDIVELSEAEYNEAMDNFALKDDGDARIREINGLKMRLVSTDYQAIKYAEGEMSEEEYSPIKAKRREWRERINELEAELD